MLLQSAPGSLALRSGLVVCAQAACSRASGFLEPQVRNLSRAGAGFKGKRGHARGCSGGRGLLCKRPLAAAFRETFMQVLLLARPKTSDPRKAWTEPGIGDGVTSVLLSRAAFTKEHRRGGFCRRRVLSHDAGGWRSRRESWRRVMVSEASRRWGGVFLLRPLSSASRWPSPRQALPCSSLCACLCPHLLVSGGHRS